MRTIKDMPDILATLVTGGPLTTEQAQGLVHLLAQNTLPTAQVAAVLGLLNGRGLALAELRGFVLALRELGTTLDLGTSELLDVCGTGGDGKNTFNISTLTAFVLAGTGVKVAKHGNYSATSHCGSSNVLEYLGLRFTSDAALLRRDLAETNLCLLHAPLFQPALRAVAEVRRGLGMRTFFNLCGPLLNPARPLYSFIGVADPATLRLYRYFLETGNRPFCLVHTRGGYDEITLTGPADSVTQTGTATFYPTELFGLDNLPDNLPFGLERGFFPLRPSDLHGGANVAEAAQIFLNILRGTGTPAQRAVVVANAAHALRLGRPAWTLAECFAACAESLENGQAYHKFQCLYQLHQG